MRNKQNYFVGDLITDTGPGIVNKNIIRVSNERFLYSKSNNRSNRIINLIKKINKTNIYLISGISKENLIVIILAKIFRKKTVYLMHGSLKIENHINGDRNSKSEKIEFFTLKHSDKIICVSKKFSNIIKNKYPQWENKIDYSYNGVNIPYVSNQSIKKGKYNFLTVGPLNNRKHSLMVCKAISEIDNNDIVYTIVGGNGDEYNEIINYPFVKYIPCLDHKNILDEMKRTNIYIQNSIFETFGLAILEAAYCGCKLLVSNCAGALDCIDNMEDYNIIFDNNDVKEIKKKILILLEDDGKEQTPNIERMSWENTTKRLFDILDGIK